MKKSTCVLWAACTAGSFISGAMLAALFWLPYAQARALADRFSKDGSMDSFSAGMVGRLSLLLRVGSVALIALGLALVIFRPRARVWLEAAASWLGRGFQRWWADFRPLGRSLARDLAGVERWEWAGMGLTMAVGAGVRLAQISHGMAHDEAYTFEAFAAESLRFITSNYQLPNNHVFHTILVHFSTRLFGIQPWAVRFPAFLAGALAVPFGFLLARKLYGTPTAVLSAGLLAVCPVLIDYSTNARGYTLVALFALILMLLAVYVKEHSNLAAWSTLVVVSGLGFYTVPIMLYPFGGVLAWLFFSALAGDFGAGYRTRWALIGCLAAAGAGTVLLTGALYYPIIRDEGLRALTGNSFVQSLPWNDFRQVAASRLQDTLLEWGNRLPNLWAVFGLGLLLSLGLHWRITRQRIPPQAAFAAWIALGLVVQRPNPWPKIWLWLVPLLLIWIAAGWVAPFRLFRPGRRSLEWAAAGILGAAALGGGIWIAAANHAGIMTPSSTEQTAVFLRGQVQPEDVVVVDSPDDAPLWYYLRLHGVAGTAVHGIKSRAFTRAFVVVDSAQRQTIPSVISARGPDLVFLHVESAQVVAQYGSETIFLVQSYPERVKKAYGGG